MSLPTGYISGPARVEEWEQVLRLITTCNIRDLGESLMSAQALEDLWNQLDLELDTWVVYSPDGKLAAYGDLQRRGPIQFDVSFFTAAGHPQAEITVYLLGQMETRAITMAARAARLIGRVFGDNQSANQAFEQTGFIPGLTFLVMETSMDSPPAQPHWPEGILVRPFVRGQDEQVTYKVDEETSMDKGYHSPLSYDGWAERMGLNRLDFDPSIWFLACKDEQVIGVALNNLSQNSGTGWVDHLGVLRECRNQGIGMALLRHSFSVFYGRGVHTVKLSVDSASLTNAPRLYEKAGMRTVQQYHIFSKTTA
jgi:mycothiol synthase